MCTLRQQRGMSQEEFAHEIAVTVSTVYRWENAHAEPGKLVWFFFFQAEDGIRDHCVTGVQTCALPILPCTAAIPDSVPTLVNVPPFAFAGRGGRSKYLVPIDYMGFEPRLGFAWSPKMKIFGLDLQEKSVVIRAGYGLSHLPLTGNNRSPNPDFGGFVNVSTVANGSAAGGTADVTQPINLSRNPVLQGTTGTLDSILGTDSSGLVFLKSLGV